MKRKQPILLGLAGILLVGAAVWVLYWRGSEGRADRQPIETAEAVPPVLSTEIVSMRSGDTFADLLRRTGVDGGTITELIPVVEQTFDVRKFRAGSQLTLTRYETGELESIQYVIDPDRLLHVSYSEDGAAAVIRETPGEIRVTRVCGQLQGSLFQSIAEAGESPELALRIAEIFAWDVDFYTDPREGDQFCVLVEKKEYDNGQPASYQRILAARYNNAGTVYEGFLFHGGESQPQYYSSDGRSLQAAFLRSPLKFEARVSSRFSRRRFHPVLKIYRPHLGTDYAAPTGTPVQAVASGRVVFSGRSGGAGNLVRIRHSGGYETYYMHLSRRLVRSGQRVEQGQRIGLVGATGLATGPHLDFRISQNGRFVDFERLDLPRTASLGPEYAEPFAAVREHFSRLMESGPELPQIAD